MKHLSWIRLLLVILFLGALGLPLYYPVLYIHYTRWTNEDDYPKRKDRYEAIVAALKKQEIPERRMACFSISVDRDPASLKRIKDEDVNNDRFELHKSGRSLDVAWLQDGSIVATFYNKDLWGFGGTFVTIHSPISPSSAQIGLQGVFKQVAPVWWAGHID